MPTDPVYPVTQQTAWTYAEEGGTVYFTSTDPLSDPDTYTYSKTGWSTTLTGTDQYYVIDPSVESNNLALKFVGTPASATIASAGTRRRGVVGVWGISQVVSGGNTEYLGEFLGSAVVEVGTVAATGSAFLPNGSGSDAVAVFCRSIEPKVDRSLFPGFRVVGQEEEACPILLIDSMGYDTFIVEMRRQDEGGTKADDLSFLYRML